MDDQILSDLRQVTAGAKPVSGDPILDDLRSAVASSALGTVEPPRTFKNMPAIGGAAFVSPSQVEAPPVPAWRQFLEHQNTPEAMREGGLIGSLARGGAEAVGSTVLNAPGALASQAGGFISGLGSAEQFDSPTMRNVGAVLSRIGAAITPGHWSEPTTALGSAPAAVGNAVQGALDVSGKGYQALGEQTGIPRAGAIAGNVVSHLPLVAGAGEAASSGLGALRSKLSGPSIAQGTQGVTAAGGTALRATPLPDVSQLTPETQAAVQLAQDRQIPLHPDVLARHLEAESLPIPGKLTEGQATAGIIPGGLDKLSKEWNLRGQNGLADKFGSQNQTLLDNFGAIKENAAPNVTATTPAQTGQGIIDGYLRHDAPINGAIDSQWDSIRNASKSAPIFDAGKMLQDSQSALEAKLLSSIDPGGQIAGLTTAARRGGLTAEGYRNFRYNLGQIAMKGGIEGQAASTIIDATNASELLPEASQFRGMVNDALQAGRNRRAAMDADPAYKAAVNGTVPPDDFVRRFVVNGNDADVALMRQTLDPLGQQHMAAGAMDYLSGRSGVLNGSGNVSQAGLNRALYGANGISSKLTSIFDPKSAQDVESLAGFARSSQQQPRGSYINNSNTFTAAAAHGLAEAGAVALGVPPGVVTMGREMLQRRAAKKAGQQALRPGAGIEQP